MNQNSKRILTGLHQICQENRILFVLTEFLSIWDLLDWRIPIYIYIYRLGSLALVTILGEWKALNSNHNVSGWLNPDNQFCESMSSRNSHIIFQKNGIMSKVYCFFLQRNMSMLVEYHSEKENSFYSTVFAITGYIAWPCHCNIITFIQSGIGVT